MDKYIFFATMLAIAMLVALVIEYGVLFVCLGILAYFMIEFCNVTAFDGAMTERDYSQKIQASRQMLYMHAIWCLCTLLLAASLGFMSGFDTTSEVPVGHGNFTYETVRQDGWVWWLLPVLLIIRAVMQDVIEKIIEKNKKRSRFE